MVKMFNPLHPGGVLAEELEFLGVSTRNFASHIGVAPSSVTCILNEKGPITPKTTVRISGSGLTRFFIMLSKWRPSV